MKKLGKDAPAINAGDFIRKIRILLPDLRIHLMEITLSDIQYRKRGLPDFYDLEQHMQEFMRRFEEADKQSKPNTPNDKPGLETTTSTGSAMTNKKKTQIFLVVHFKEVLLNMAKRVFGMSLNLEFRGNEEHHRLSNQYFKPLIGHFKNCSAEYRQLQEECLLQWARENGGEPDNFDGFTRPPCMRDILATDWIYARICQKMYKREEPFPMAAYFFPDSNRASAFVDGALMSIREKVRDSKNSDEFEKGMMRDIKQRYSLIEDAIDVNAENADDDRKEPL
jgi:hypothetical protein